jgi:poly-gamma-glutamate synthesis protein (capsule biosynthesis protein)
MLFIIRKMMRKNFQIFSFVSALFLFLPGFLSGQTSETGTTEVSFLFIGDIMGHDTQIKAAFNKEDSTYNYEEYFEYLTPLFNETDFVIANFEVTLAGEPIKGYPQFSSPDELAYDCKNAGINFFACANNHCCDRGLKGIDRTINVLDMMDIPHTGTFKSVEERDKNYPVVLEKNGIRIALLNYTYGTNGLPVPQGKIVNLIDKDQIEMDLEKAKTLSADKIIVFLHWGKEYQSEPNAKQEELADFIFAKGGDIIIGSHPHVIQKMMWMKGTDGKKEHLIAYSLGNFVSNQRKRYTDGGTLAKFTLTKTGDDVSIKEAGYILNWVYKSFEQDGTHYRVLPVSQFENEPGFFISKEYFDKMGVFIKDSRTLYKEQNVNMNEYLYEPSSKKWFLSGQPAL